MYQGKTWNMELGTSTAGWRHSGPSDLSRRSLKGEDGNEEPESRVKMFEVTNC